jgi:hypothetical protein
MPTQLQLPTINDRIIKISKKYYGDHKLDPISGAGQVSHPKLALVFINPTKRNISTNKTWDGLKAPWIGCANIWQLFADANLIDSEVNKAIQLAKSNWSKSFTIEVYHHVAIKGLYITNMVKWAGLDARLPEREKIKLYSPILIEELKILKPERIIAFGQLTFEGIQQELGIKNTESFSNLNEQMLIQNKVFGISTSIGQVVPCYFPVGQGIKNINKAIEILKLVSV